MPYIKVISWFFFLISFLDARTFTSSDGVRKMEASISAFDEKSEVVSIIRKDGKSFNSKISSFSVGRSAIYFELVGGNQRKLSLCGKGISGPPANVPEDCKRRRGRVWANYSLSTWSSTSRDWKWSHPISRLG